MRGHRRSDGLLGDYCDGSLYQSHALFSTETVSLQLMIYYDELELCNPLGSKAKLHKVGESCILLNQCVVGIFYYILGNISPRYRSQLKAIQLLAIAKSSVVIKYGPDTILESFMGDLKVLEEVSPIILIARYTLL